MFNYFHSGEQGSVGDKGTKGYRGPNGRRGPPGSTGICNLDVNPELSIYRKYYIFSVAHCTVVQECSESYEQAPLACSV